MPVSVRVRIHMAVTADKQVPPTLILMLHLETVHVKRHLQPAKHVSY